MNSILTRQTMVVRILVAILCIVLLVGVLLILGSITGTHPSQTGIMLISSPYRLT